MDAYSKYNQIRMHPYRQSQTTFIIDKGNYYIQEEALKPTRISARPCDQYEESQECEGSPPRDGHC
ncbi:hypothetical protein CR513_41882, partial [Mucuna pruriens]